MAGTKVGEIICKGMQKTKDCVVEVAKAIGAGIKSGVKKITGVVRRALFSKW